MDQQRIEQGYWYHTLALPRGDGTTLMTPGEYDHAPFLAKYGFPESLAGLRAMDVGTADGYFAFEMERRGAASVSAADIAAYPDVPFHEVETFGQGVQRGDTRFETAKAMLGSKVQHIEASVYDLNPDEHGTYDFIFCGSLLLHLTDPLRAVQGIRRVATGRVIIATAYYHEPLLALYERVLSAGMRMRGKKTGVKFASLVQTEMDDTFWLPTKAALLNLTTRSGFRDARIHSTFRLDRRDGRRGWPHAVVHAHV
jgi:tRNA (mo5U34)-methyltransferase